MNKIRIKLDGISPGTEISTIQRIKPDIIGVDISEHFFSVDMIETYHRFIENFNSIFEEIGSSVCLGVNLNILSHEQCIAIVNRHKPQYVEFYYEYYPSKDVIAAIESYNGKIIFSHIDISETMGNRYIDYVILEYHKHVPNIDFFQLELLGEYEDAWKVITEIAAKRNDMLTAGDLESIASKHPIYIQMLFSVDNICDVITSIASTKGIVFDLRHTPEREVEHAVEKLRSQCACPRVFE